jgi:hypothetical protein
MTTNTDRKKEYSMSWLIFGNSAIIVWIVLGAVSCALFVPLIDLLFFAVGAFLVFYELGKHGCVSCFYCKTCTIGMGKLPELFFSPNEVVNANRRALKLFPWTFLLLSVVPLAFIAFSLVQEFTIFKVALLAALAAFSLYSGIMKRKNLIKQKRHQP